MATILESLENARYNLVENKGVGIAELLGVQQLDNAITLLEKGYPVDFDFEHLFTIWEKMEDVPEYETLELFMPKGKKISK